MALRMRMTWLAAGVLRMPSWPMMSFLTPYAAPIFAISCTTSGFQNLPSPPITRVASAAPSGIDRRMEVTNDSL